MTNIHDATSVPTRIKAPLVGAHFRPPAKALLAALPFNHPLLVRPEPTNPYDPNALAVYLESETLHELSEANLSELDHALGPQGQDLSSVMAQPEWHVGYVAATFAKEVRPATEAANLAFLTDGKYAITFDAVLHIGASASKEF